MNDEGSLGAWTLRPYAPVDRDAFIALNLDWIQDYFSVEPSDEDQLNRLEVSILGRGGRILVAEEGGAVVGVGAIVPPHHDPKDGRRWFEVIKMATDRSRRGQGIGRGVLRGLIDEAKALDGDALWLETNGRLEPALRLYLSEGFQSLQREDWWPTPYTRCDRQMILEL